METFTLSFSEKIGKTVHIYDEGEFYCGDFISGRSYTGIFNGSFSKKDGIYFRIDDQFIGIKASTKITFYD